VDTSVVLAIIALVSSLGGIVIANRYTARTARQAQVTTAEIEKDKIEQTSWRELNQGLREEVKRLRDDARADREEWAAQLEKVRTDALTHGHDCAKQLDRLRQQIEQDAARHNRDRAHLARQVDALVDWGRAVVRQGRVHDWQLPSPPPALADTDPHMIRVED
jgi:septal ring factor EnvC (AmiA/AmiB activator)